MASAVSPNELPSLSAVSLPQLSSLKDQLEKELDLFTASFSTLKTAQQKYQQNLVSLDELEPENKGKEMLVPLTSSVYVPGSLVSVDRVLIDVGTGYFTHKSIPDAKRYFASKIEWLKEELDKIQQNIYLKQDSLLTIMNEMQLKVAQQDQAAR